MLLLLDGVTMLSLELHEVIVEEISCFEHHLVVMQVLGPIVDRLRRPLYLDVRIRASRAFP